MAKEARHVSATPEQWAIIDTLAAQDAEARHDKPDRSRTLVELALAEHDRRQKKGKAKR